MERKWLEKIRNDKGLSQEQFALILKIPASTYSTYETGIRNPKVSEAKRLAKILKIEWTKFYEKLN